MQYKSNDSLSLVVVTQNVKAFKTLLSMNPQMRPTAAEALEFAHFKTRLVKCVKSKE
jgi:hypothetical protein